MKFASLIAVFLLAATSVFADGSKQRSPYSGVLFTYMGGSGTNSVIEIDNSTNVVPWQLTDVDCTTNGVATAVKIYRVWAWNRPIIDTVVSTNFFGTVVTNVANFVGYRQTMITNEVYDSSTDTLPIRKYFLDGDIVRVDFQSETNAIIRIIGTAE